MEGQGENDELYPIAVLIDELKVGRGRKTHPITPPFFRWVSELVCANQLDSECVA
jgi:hypothetical protein